MRNWVAYLFLVLIQLCSCQLPSVEQVSYIQFPWLKKRCCNTHNVFLVDRSGSMNWGGSWSKVLTFLSSTIPTSDYVSLSLHGGGWSGPPFLTTTTYLHQLNPPIPTLPAPYGDTDYDDLLIAAINILSGGYPDRTCLYFISDGWEEIYNKPLPNVISAFLMAKKRFQKTTGCPVCLKCYQTQQNGPQFANFCKQIGAPLYSLASIKIQFVETYLKDLEYLKTAQIKFTFNGDRPKPTGDQVN